MPGPACTICTRSDEAEITRALRLPGVSIHDVAARFPGASYSALKRHRRDHHRVPPPAEAAQEAGREVAQTEGDSPEVIAVKTRSHFLSQFLQSTSRGDARAAIGFGGLALRANEQIAAMQGRLSGGGTTVNVGVAVGGPDSSLEVAIAILAALKDEPAAREKVLRALCGAGIVPQIEGEAEPLAIEDAGAGQGIG